MNSFVSASVSPGLGRAASASAHRARHPASIIVGSASSSLARLPSTCSALSLVWGPPARDRARRRSAGTTPVGASTSGVHAVRTSAAPRTGHRRCEPSRATCPNCWRWSAPLHESSTWSATPTTKTAPLTSAGAPCSGTPRCKTPAHHRRALGTPESPGALERAGAAAAQNAAAAASPSAPGTRSAVSRRRAFATSVSTERPPGRVRAAAAERTREAGSSPGFDAMSRDRARGRAPSGCATGGGEI